MEKKKYTGLTLSEAEKRLEQYGKNSLRSHKKKSPILVFLGQFTDLMIIILLVCTAVSAFMGDIIEAVVMVCIVVVNAFLGFIQEYRTEKTLEALRGMTAPSAVVIREGKEIKIPAENIVPGDIVKITTGDRVPADGYIIESAGLNVDESVLTGESVAVFKESGQLYSGTVITGGHGIVEVTDTGMKTEMGKISGMIQDAAEESTPLQKRLAKLGTIIVVGCIVICAAVIAVGIIKGEPMWQMLMAGISLAVAAVPEGLPAIVTISLAMGVQKMAAKNALVRKLPAVETLGSTSVICSDKTGTLTMNKMKVQRILTPDDIYDGRDNNGFAELTDAGIESNKKCITDDAVKRLISIAVNCNNNDGATESALYELKKLAEDNYTKNTYESDAKLYRFGEIPFSSSRKCMSTAVESDGKRMLFTKGAPDIILSKCTHVYRNGRVVQLDTVMRKRINVSIEKMAASALRVMGFAWRNLGISENVSSNNEKQIESRLVFAGLCGIADPLRPEVPGAVRTCREAGIRTVMITGDHKNTARAIADEMGLCENGADVVTGEEIEKMSDDELCETVKKTSVFARVLPVHKLRLVKAFKKNGNIVSMTGDGVNDAPAVKEADIGIAMGKNGTEVTREASSMVLLDDNFATIVSAVRCGRSIYANIRKFIRYMLACNLGEVITMLAVIIAGLPLPLIPIQILWVNLVTDGLPGIALGMDGEEDDVMKQPPMKKDGGIFTKRMAGLVIFRGILTGLCTLAAFALVLHSNGDLKVARTTAFVTLVLIQLVHSFECRSETKNFFQIGIRGNYFLLISVLISLILMVAVVYIPVLQGVFSTAALGLEQWITIILITLIGPVAGVMFTADKKRKSDK
ncbi:MAG: calcium-translocating P-type ATPase, PMCA-type [Clostridia bacterium]|nr:calcium-translocating P-type ATPase, PMCA-type [Clostridia bacterium]